MKDWDNMKPGDDVSLTIDGVIKKISIDPKVTRSGNRTNTYRILLDTDQALISMRIKAISK
jgi:hypothetical protein